jgi:2-polyprenyl-6-methoxyphenol hydroxylase-like FAD-dependent oxidoreductase
MTNRSVLIVGGGVAGPLLAIWLRRSGFEPTVVERAPALRAGGYKVDVRGAAVSVLDRIGLLDAARAASTGMRGASYVNQHGARVASTDADFFGGRTTGDLELMRGDLVQLFYDASRQHVEYIFSDTLASLSEDESGVTVAFTSGVERVFDLVVGADGLHSGVRALAFGNEAEHGRHLGHYISIFSTANHLRLDRWELLYAVPGKTINVYSAGSSARAHALFLFASGPLDVDARDVAAQKRFLAQHYGDVGWEAPRLLEQMWSARDFYFDSISQIQMDRWSLGRVVLLGDAAYGPSPASGQGTSMAIVGAYVLARELAAAAGNHSAAFARYEREMRPYVDVNQKLALSNLRGIVTRSRLQIWLQTGFIRMLPYLPCRERLMRRITAPIHQAATAISLSD